MSCNCKSVAGAVARQAASTVAHGAIGLAKYVTRTGLAPSVVIARRRDLCNACEHADMGFCTVCKCLLLAKTSLAQERCPLNPPKWQQL